MSIFFHPAFYKPFLLLWKWFIGLFVIFFYSCILWLLFTVQRSGQRYWMADYCYVECKWTQEWPLWLIIYLNSENVMPFGLKCNLGHLGEVEPLAVGKIRIEHFLLLGMFDVGPKLRVDLLGLLPITSAMTFPPVHKHIPF